MIELADEIGREHVRALKELREAAMPGCLPWWKRWWLKLRGGTAPAVNERSVICIVYDENVTNLHRAKQTPPRLYFENTITDPTGVMEHYTEARGTTPAVIYMSRSVYGMLLSHGLVRPGTGDPNRAPVGGVKGLLYSERAQEFMGRVLLRTLLGVFPSRVNKWAVLGVAMVAFPPLSSLVNAGLGWVFRFAWALTVSMWQGFAEALL